MCYFVFGSIKYRCFIKITPQITQTLLSPTGPMVWYQKFEYAIGHWLQKAAEHMLGCVLCSPGCFSLFRGSAIMDDNVMRTYATKSTEARHYVQYDQGKLIIRDGSWNCRKKGVII